MDQEFQLVLHPSLLLLENCDPYTMQEDEAELRKKHAAALSEGVVKYGGIGLAAPQIGILMRSFATNFCGTPKVFFSPEIITASPDMVDSVEGCLSIPGKLFRVPRHKSVTLKYLDGSSGLVERDFYGLLAVVVQHEIDHLDGILICHKGAEVV